MSAKIFLDTNILAYAFDPSAPDKQTRSREIMSGDRWMISWQVIQEFANLALHRFAVPMKSEDLSEYLDLMLWPRCMVLPSPQLYETAMEVQRQTQYRFYDSLVVASAVASGASTLFSEDLQTGRKIGPLMIQNPFA